MFGEVEMLACVADGNYLPEVRAAEPRREWGEAVSSSTAKTLPSHTIPPATQAAEMSVVIFSFMVVWQRAVIRRLLR